MPYRLKHIGRLGLLVAAIGSSAHADHHEFQQPVYQVHRAGTPVNIDGRLDEPAWVAAPDLGNFRFTWYESGDQEQTVAKLLWDDEYLYVAHICQDAHITARVTEHDGPIPQDDCFEIMIAPNPDKPAFYFNIEWNLLGASVDGHRPNGPDSPREPWDASGLKVAATYVGTLNDDTDRDSHWIVEVAIPLSNFQEYFGQFPLTPGDSCHANFNRHGGDTNLQYSQWSSGGTPAPSFHTPHRFGRLVFSEKTSPFEPARSGAPTK